MITGSAPLLRELETLAKHLRSFTVQVQRRRLVVGAGVIWRSSGVIVTNDHVLRGPSATVKLADGRLLAATVAARDSRLDLAALRVEAGDLPAASMGYLSSVRVGELVFAMGNPVGHVGALTMGIVQALGPRSATRGPDWIRADLDLPRGYSGGPLADARGRIIGINTMAAGDLALAMPSDRVESFLAEAG
jgi:serine protease Do